MKLYFAPGACSLSPHIVLNEAGLPYQRVKTDTKTKITESGGDFKQVNPLGYVPVLELDDGTKLTEGPAIVQYVADQVPAKKLAPPAGTMERTRLQSWLNFVSSELHKGFSPLFNPSMPEEAKKIFRQRLATRFAHVNDHLAGNEYLMGKDFSVADAYLFTISNWAARVDIDLSPFPNVLAYRKAGGRASLGAGGTASRRLEIATSPLSPNDEGRSRWTGLSLSGEKTWRNRATAVSSAALPSAA